MTSFLSKAWKYILAIFSLLVAVIFFQRKKIKEILSQLSISDTKEKDATFKEQDRQNDIKQQEEADHREQLKKANEAEIGKNLSTEETEEFFKKRGF